MRYLFLFLFTISSIKLHSQENFKDTISLQEVKISNKKPKVVTVKQGKGKQETGNGFFKTALQQAYLIEGLPYGTLQNITLHFMWMSMTTKTGMLPTSKVESTTYEVTLHEVTDNKIGKAINNTPLLVKLPAGRKSEPSATVDLSTLQLTTNRLFIILKRVSDLPCAECNFYILMGYHSEKQLHYQGDLQNITIQNKTTLAPNPDYYTGLLCEIKTLTQEY
ncbi:hypothetical protein ACLI1A_00915 [Flavobacterium sp. RHBU_3]|uniref:hypothetical protein n=1 Tax=Flavobacterium sp. RHBU_3 TaxID=3391184 RepID=UPI0039854E4C